MSLKGHIVLILLFVLGAAAYVAWSELLPILTYQPTPAQVKAAWIEFRASPSGPHGYVPRVEYEYRVRNQNWRSSRFTPREPIGDSAWAMDKIKTFSPGLQITAYVNSRDPQQAFLVKEVFWRVYVDAAIVVLLIACTSLWFRRAKSRRVTAEQSTIPKTGGL